jgi:hypothetical protein
MQLRSEKRESANDSTDRDGQRHDFYHYLDAVRCFCFSGFRRKRFTAAFTVLAVIVLFFALYLLSTRIIFLVNARSFETHVVAVVRENVPKGRSSVLAYVPIVEIRDDQGQPQQVKVSTFDESPIYIIGQGMRVTCAPARGCIEDSFVAKWGDVLIDLLISIVLFVPLLYYRLAEISDPKAKPLDL